MSSVARPRYAAVFAWKIAPDFASDTFEFSPPPAARRLAIRIRDGKADRTVQRCDSQRQYPYREHYYCDDHAFATAAAIAAGIAVTTALIGGYGSPPLASHLRQNDRKSERIPGLRECLVPSRNMPDRTQLILTFTERNRSVAFRSLSIIRVHCGRDVVYIPTKHRRISDDSRQVFVYIDNSWFFPEFKNKNYIHPVYFLYKLLFTDTAESETKRLEKHGALPLRAD